MATRTPETLTMPPRSNPRPWHPALAAPLAAFVTLAVLAGPDAAVAASDPAALNREGRAPPCRS